MPSKQKVEEVPDEKRRYEAYKQEVQGKDVEQLKPEEMKWRLQGCKQDAMPRKEAEPCKAEDMPWLDLDDLDGSGAIKRGNVQRAFVLSVSKIEEVKKPRAKGKKGKAKGKGKGSGEQGKGKGDKQDGQNVYLGQQGQVSVVTLRVFGEDVLRLNMYGDGNC